MLSTCPEWNRARSDKSEMVLQTSRQVQLKFIFLISQAKHMLWVLKDPSHWDDSFEHPKEMLKLMDKKIFTNLRSWNWAGLWWHVPGLLPLGALSSQGTFLKSSANGRNITWNPGGVNCTLWSSNSSSCGTKTTNLGGLFLPGIYLQTGTTSRSLHLFSRAVNMVVLPNIFCNII